GMYADALGDIPQRDAVQPMFGEQVLGGVEDSFERFRPLLGFGTGFGVLARALRHRRDLTSMHGGGAGNVNDRFRIAYCNASRPSRSFLLSIFPVAASGIRSMKTTWSGSHQSGTLPRSASRMSC